MDSLLSLVFSFFFSRFVAIWPTVRKEGDRLVATTSWKARIWNLGSASRRLVVDPGAKTARLQIRRFWFFQTSRRIEFDWVAGIGYRYSDVSPGVWAHQQADLFTIDLKLKNGDRVMLFRFFGEGDFVNNGIWPDWMYWDDFLVAKYTKGDQESQSMLLADLLSRMIGVPIADD